MTRAHFVKKARKADRAAGIKKGDSYWWWKFRKGGMHKSKTRPKASQLTQSPFYSTMLEYQEELEEATQKMRSGEMPRSQFSELLQTLADQVRELGDECQGNLDNMPEGLQQGSSGELLQARIDECEQIAQDLESAADEANGEPSAEEVELMKRAWLADRIQINWDYS